MTSDTVLVVNEPFVEDFCRTQRWAARTRGRVLRPPDWLAYATAVLEAAEMNAELYDFPALRWEKDHLRRLVEKKTPALVVLDSTTPSIYSDIDCARIVKEASAETKVLMVGPHVTTCPEVVLRLSDGAVDAAALGEYEYTVRDFAQTILAGKSSWHDIAGLAWLDSKDFVTNVPRPLIDPLDELPFPAWGHLRLDDYFDGIKYFPYVDIIGGRGCPFQCSFCLWPQVMHGKGYRLRSIDNIVAEMSWVLDKWPFVGRGEFFFEDDTFTVDPERAHGLCDAISAAKLDVSWSVNTRADVKDLSVLAHMKAAGCRMVLVGFESGVQSLLDGMHKGVTVEQMRRFAAEAASVGLDIHGCFVLGLPGETKQTMAETLAFAQSLPLSTVQFSAAVPFPGTKYFNKVKEEGHLVAKRWDQWLADGEQAQVVSYPGLSKGEIDEAVDKGLRDFYFRPSYMVRFLFATRSRGDLYRKLRGLKNFLAYLWQQWRNND